MSLGLLHLVGKYLVALFITAISFFNISGYKENKIGKQNSQLNKNGPIVTAISYNTEVTYNDKRPSNLSKVLNKGEVGLSYYDEETNKTIVIKNEKSHVVEQGSGAYGIYKGRLVGYGPDCVGCSGEGYLACRTKTGDAFSLKHDGIYYDDEEYGKVRILAANLYEFPCGTMVKVEKEDGKSFNAIVLDRIGTQLEGQTLMDLAYSTQTDKSVFAADGLVGYNITFNIQRWGF